MAAQRTSIHGEWSSRWTYVLAATGAAVGLGNIWKFPYLAGEHGGGAFVLVYLICVALIGIPMMMAEVMLGRRGRQTPMNTMRTLAEEARTSTHWQWLGWSGTLAGFLILSYYSVVGSWTLAYIFFSMGDSFGQASAEGVAQQFAEFVGDPWEVIGWHLAFLVFTMYIVARGVRSGLERAVQLLMPALFILLLVLVGYAGTTGSFRQGLTFLFFPDFSKLSGAAMLDAMGQAFFSLSLGMGTIMIYGSYVPHDMSIARTSIAIALADTAVALVAGMAIFPIVFANGLAPEAGPSLIFQTIPLAFSHMPGGTLFGALFFMLLLIAAWTSAISLIEPAMTLMVENYRMSRSSAAAWCGLATWLIALGTIFSFNIWEDFRVFRLTFFDLVDFVTANLMLPLGGVCMAIFSGWLMDRRASEDELGMANSAGYLIWRGLIRYIAPLAVLMVFLHTIGVL